MYGGVEMFERISERPLDPPEDVVADYCNHCGGEIYEGETVYRINGRLIHEDCLWDFAKDCFADCKEEAEVRVRAKVWPN